MRDNLEKSVLFENIAVTIPKGFAYYKIVSDSKANSLDCITLGMNRIYREIFGYSEDFIGKPLSECIKFTQITQIWLERFDKIANSGESETFEYQMPSTNLWYSVTGFSFLKGYYAVIIDNITEVKNLSIENEKYLREFEMIFNGTQDAIFVLEVLEDNVLKFKRLNKSHEIATGLTTELVKGKTPFELMGNKVGQELYDKYMTCVLSKTAISYEETLTLLTGTKTWLTTLSPVIQDDEVIQIIGSARDITDRIVAENLMNLEKEKMSVTLESINDGVITTDLEGIITYINDSARKIIEMPTGVVIGNNFDDVFVIHERNMRNLLKVYLLKVFNHEFDVERFNNLVLQTNDSVSKTITYKRAPIIGADKMPSGVVITISDETKHVENEEKLAYLSLHDKLTGLYNRTFFDEELIRLDTERQLPLSIIIGDVNGLKISNDVFGHLAGDQLLIEVSNIFKSVLRAEDIIARWGGDEFVALLPNTSESVAKEVCDRIKSLCQKADEKPIRPSISLGVATKYSSEQSILDQFNIAEAQMYKNKLSESKQNRDQIIGSLKNRLKVLNLETIEHCDRIKIMVRSIATKMNLNNSEVELLAILADIHDIGNIGVKANTLSKAGLLDEYEWIEVKKHPEIGYRIAQANADLITVAELILTHHENWDGSGYPQGLAGTQIPKLSRVLRLFDAYDVMTHEKPYRRAKTKEQAFDEIRKCTGTQFDPKFAELFINAIKDNEDVANEQ